MISDQKVLKIIDGLCHNCKTKNLSNWNQLLNKIGEAKRVRMKGFVRRNIDYGKIDLNTLAQMSRRELSELGNYSTRRPRKRIE